uniref:Terpene synthase n=1 Tax=Psidium guajava TaxID=120290 RepID=A0AA95ZDX2_PSIGU|nr:terpene synthase [Psidium guajava]
MNTIVYKCAPSSDVLQCKSCSLVFTLCIGHISTGGTYKEREICRFQFREFHLLLRTKEQAARSNAGGQIIIRAYGEFKYLGRVEEQIEGLKGEVRKIMTDVTDKPLQMLQLIDQIQRLGIFYHFEREIDEQLEQIHKSYSRLVHGVFKADDLHMIALIFRLLQQQGHNVSSEVFNKFKDGKGKFRESLVADAHGLLSLYEACHLRCHDDAILEEAFHFAMTRLESIDERKVSTNLAKQVKRALKQPLRMGLPRLEARYYIPLYREEPSHDKVLLALAELDFNLLREQHQKELGKITRWWKDIDVARKFPFARDRIVELFFWISGVYFEPEFAVAREILTKVIALLSILDDIYDVYGTLEELVILTEAIQKSVIHILLPRTSEFDRFH